MKKLIIKAIAAYLIPLLRKEAKKTPTLIDDYMIIRSISIEKEPNEKTQEYCNSTGRTVSGLITILLIKFMEGNPNEQI